MLRNHAPRIPPWVFYINALRLGSIPHVPFINVDAVFHAKSAKLILKRYDFVVLFLILDVCD